MTSLSPSACFAALRSACSLRTRRTNFSLLSALREAVDLVGEISACCEPFGELDIVLEKRGKVQKRDTERKTKLQKILKKGVV